MDSLDLRKQRQNKIALDVVKENWWGHRENIKGKGCRVDLIKTYDNIFIYSVLKN